MIQLVEKMNCTGCGACAFVCASKSIIMKADLIGQVYPVINTDSCIECASCVNVCPVFNPAEKYKPLKAYAVWSNNNQERVTSASGGIAVEIYKEALLEGYQTAGAVMNEDFTVTFSLTDQVEQLNEFKNSKYVFSDMYELFPKLKAWLRGGGKAVVIGLPCQIAALRNLFKNHINLLLVDLVCHGSTPYSYLHQHVTAIEKRCGAIAKRVLFRDPYFATHTFTFTLYNSENKRFYAKRTKHGDSYQYGYHRWISYRENCYHCHFACSQRVGDITLCDYTGLGSLLPANYGHHDLSCILINSTKGGFFIDTLIDKKRIVAEERPLQEPLESNAQLQRPTPKTSLRLEFEKNIRRADGDFERAIKPLVRKWLLRNYVCSLVVLPWKVIKIIVKQSGFMTCK